MRYLIFLILIFSIFNYQIEVFASNSFSGLETQITPDSSSDKIEKLQNLFYDLGLYNGEIDGNYESIEGNLINYQISVGIINSSEDWGAGYFGEATMKSLQEKYGDKFDELAQKYLLLETIELGERTFFVTAYYSPLPNQEKYSYSVYKKRYRTYEEEIKLQGDGKITASGEEVFVGLIAAPKNYPFGTKIELKGIGVGVVEDRGGAIVNAGERGHEYDRIDIWMGYGDEGLERANKWGKREIKGEILEEHVTINIEFDESVVLEYSDLRIDAENPETEDVKELQQLFTDIGLYNGSIDGNFTEIKDTLVSYQLKNGIIFSENDEEAGYFGKKTLAVLRKEYGSGIFKEPDNDDEVYLSSSDKEKLDKIGDILDDYLEKKSNGDSTKKEKYKEGLRLQIDKYIDNMSNNYKIIQLTYLKNIL